MRQGKILDTISEDAGRGLTLPAWGVTLDSEREVSRVPFDIRLPNQIGDPVEPDLVFFRPNPTYF